MDVKTVDKQMRRVITARIEHTEFWNSFAIRFVRVDKEWYAVGMDVAMALDYDRPADAVEQHCVNTRKVRVPILNEEQICDTVKHRTTYPKQLTDNTLSSENDSAQSSSKEPELLKEDVKKTKARKTQDLLIIDERECMRLAFGSKMPKAVEFQNWVFDQIIVLRKMLGLNATQTLRMLDLDKTKSAHTLIQDAFGEEAKAVHKQVERMAGRIIGWYMAHYDVWVSKEDTSVELLPLRQEIVKTATDMLVTAHRRHSPINVFNVLIDLYIRKVPSKDTTE